MGLGQTPEMFLNEKNLFVQCAAASRWKREKKFLSRIQNGNGKIQMCLFFVGAGRHPNV